MTTTNLRDESDYDVVIVGGGPAGSTTATLLAQQGLRVVVFEQEAFPRFHVGESLLPANLPIFDRLGCHQAMQKIGLIEKPGATLYDEYENRQEVTFSFPRLPFQPPTAYQVVRAPFDDFLLHHAENSGARVYRQHTVQYLRHDPEHVVMQVTTVQGETREVRGRVLVDASGRHTLLGKSFGRREPLPDLGKVALFAHFRNVQREPTIPEGNARLYLVPQGWLWWFSFADGTDSVGCVLHSQVVKARQGSIDTLFDEVVATSPRVSAALLHAQRVTAVHPVANFSYRISPSVGNRYLAVGDAAGFIDPIFSTGVFLAMRSAELATDAIVQAFRNQDFSARRFQQYAKQFRRGMASFLPFIRRFYDPAFLDILFSQRPPLHLDQPVVWVLSGAAFDHRPLRLRLGLALFFCSVHIRKAVRWMTGLPVASRLSW
jgi:flavin-dependent dehydrogenase